MRGEGFWVNTLMSASMLDIADPEAMLKAWFLWTGMGLEELGMGDVAEKLETVGRLINQ